MSNAKEQAQAQFEAIEELLEALENAEGLAEEERCEQQIQEKPLSVEFRSGWQSHGELEAAEYRILLCTGNPAVQIVGNLNQHKEPCTAVLQYEDWFTPWETHHVDEETLLRFAQYFYFGE